MIIGQWSGSSTSAFTLIEMTVVILIIAILGAASSTAISGMAERARKVQAKNDLNQLVIAVNGYYAEYRQISSNRYIAYYGRLFWQRSGAGRLYQLH